MTNEKKRELLARLFETSKRDDDTVWDHFRNYVMDKENEAYPVYQAVSDAMFNSQLTHNFSYSIAVPAVEILLEAENWNNDDDITERVDSAVPIYNYDLMQIYVSNWWAVDDACEELGYDTGNSIQRAQYGWYAQIESMVAAIRTNLNDL